MRVPMSWMQSLFRSPLPPAETIARSLTGAGIEVESITRHAPGFDHVVTGKIVKVDPHPNADRLRICQTDLGGGEPVQIVTGAANVQLGDIIPVALPGANLPAGIRIQPSKLRGVESGGMYCSRKELGLQGGVDGVEILSPDTPVGVPAAGAMGIGDEVLTLSILANRPDLMSMRGVAREVAALGLGDLVEESREALSGRGAAAIAVRLESVEQCPRYLAIPLEGITVGPSPAWVQERLAAAGVRAISNVVDVTNLVMLEWGHPMHAFDRDRLEGDALEVRAAREGDRLITLDGVDRDLQPGQLVIADARGPVALAGVMGGEASGVHDATRRIVLEVAAFDPASIRRTSRALGLHSESSQRFSRGVDPATLDVAAAEAVRWLGELAGATLAGGVTEVGGALPPAVELRVARAQVESLLGADLLDDTVQVALRKLGFGLEDVEAATFCVRVPTWRSGDVRRPVDVLEEIARFRGYGAIPALALPPRPSATLGGRESLRRRLRDTCEGLGLQEVVTSSLVPRASTPEVDEALVSLKNPLAGFEVLRTELWRGAFEMLVYNARQRSRRAPGLYELGWTHGRDSSGAIVAREALVVVLEGDQMRGTWQTAPGSLQADFGWASGLVERILGDLRIDSHRIEAGTGDAHRHPGRSASLRIGDRLLGEIFEIHPAHLAEIDAPDLGRVAIAWLDLSELEASTKRAAVTGYRAFSRQPAVTRDLALRVSQDVLAGEVLALVHEAGGEWLEDVHCFDRYSGAPLPAGQVSLGLRLTFRAEQTLTDEQIEPVMAAVLARVAEHAGAAVRDGSAG